MTVEEKEPLYAKMLEQFKDPLILLLLGLAALSLLTGNGTTPYPSPSLSSSW